MVTDGRVVAAGGVLFERTVTVGRVEAARLVEKERTVTGGHVVGTGGVEIKHIYTDGRVVGAGGVAKERFIPNSSVEKGTVGIGKSLKTDSSRSSYVLKASGPGGKALKRLITHGGVGAGNSVALEGLPPDSDIWADINKPDCFHSAASGVVRECAGANSRIAGRRVA